MIEREVRRGKFEYERTVITDEETRAARLCSRLHSCLPRSEIKRSKAHAVICYHVVLFNCGRWIEDSGETKKSKCFDKNTQVRGQEIRKCHTLRKNIKLGTDIKNKKPGTSSKKSPLINSYLTSVFRSFLNDDDIDTLH